LTLRDLTGAPGYEFIIDETENMFERILTADNKGWIIAAGCSNEKGGKEKLEKIGLVGDHSYGILKAVNIEIDGQQV